MRRPLQVQPQGSRDFLLNRSPGRCDVESKSAPGDGVVDAAQHQVGVGDRWLGATQPVADRAGHGSGAARPHVQVARRREPGDAAAARADGGDVQHRQLHRPVAQLPGQGDGGSAPVDQGYVGAGAAHVEGDAVLNPGVPGNVNGRHDPGGRAGKAGVDRLPGGGFRADDSPVGLHNQQGGLDTQLPQVAVQVFDVVADPRHDVGVEDGGYRPLVLPEDRQHLGGQRQVGLGELFQHQFRARSSWAELA